MTPRQIALVRQSWVKVQPIADEAAALFRERLFLIDPALRALFTSDPVEQGRKMMTMLSVVIHALERVESLATLQDHGQRHPANRVEPEHNPKVSEALIWALDKSLGRSFNAEVHEAWSALYERIARRMQAPETFA
jgi:nitric oxide dioxygenase